jgi:Holliday junction DNA helicase RuvA
MIARLTGVLAEKSADRIIVDVRGVGYEVHIPFSTYYELGSESDAVTLQIYTHAKGDQLSLYGFSTVREKELFTRLIQVSGIGPRLGIAILSGMPVDEFLEAVAAKDLARLYAVPGVGKKTAGRIVLEMRDRLQGLAPPVETVSLTGVPAQLRQDVVSALVNLGYVKRIAEKAVTQVLKQESPDRFEDLLRSTLRKISR